MRIANPDLLQEEQVHQTGLAIINLFATDLFAYINKEMEISEGANWLMDYRRGNIVYRNYNFFDPSNLLKELLRVSQSPLRGPIRRAINPQELVEFFNQLQIILDDRNDWVHHNFAFSLEALKNLLMNILPIAHVLHLAVSVECDDIFSKLNGVQPSKVIEVGVSSTVLYSLNLDSAIIDLIPLMTKGEPNIGDLVNDNLTAHSYVLQLSGEVRDRETGIMLSDIRPDFGHKIGVFLLVRKPNGGRIRMTSSGELVAYFEDHWGYLARIPSEYWFPPHSN